MNIEHIRLTLEVIQAVVTVVLWLYVRGVNRHHATLEHIERLDHEVGERLDDHEQRLTRVEEWTRHTPKHEDIGAVHSRINDLYGAVRELTGAMSGVQRSLSRVEDKLMNEERP